ncbi:hypothetical protein [Klebsiella pneumoniae]|uniref:hypothetical protein n=1 Tax=Klebsiella pneumoniae TaxID=573 RepID=UPI00164A4E57|nr:hypothetical protein [Klebsiella pneumoniae]MBC4858508.1 hypothetical protein [Klebsiella pneumoniae]MCF2762965.1 hypothetical protein [Klebsiella pneumoniae]MCP5993723.1 hypothetical protein [Klebsiella pneumoniae]WFA70014.1 hypothetical protein LVQ74_15140 [Klebsiella pneumoniae]HBZ1062251.1 hypothetical protein [Klebsiella pneumoniae]
MNIEAVNELIASLESAGELSIREQKFLKLAKAYHQLAADRDAVVAENAALKSAIDHTIEWIESTNGDPCDVVIIKGIETTATDRIVAGIKADGAKAAGDYLKLEAQHMPVVERLMMQDAAEICYGTAARLREGADK